MEVDVLDVGQDPPLRSFSFGIGVHPERETGQPTGRRCYQVFAEAKPSLKIRAALRLERDETWALDNCSLSEHLSY